MKYSKQRNVVLSAVCNSLDHPTADEVYIQVKAENPKISLGTVYRNLNLLSENGTIKRISVPGGSDRFDGTLIPHYHMYCTECGRVCDYPDDDVLVGLKNKIETAIGFRAENLELLGRGLCKECICKLPEPDNLLFFE